MNDNLDALGQISQIQSAERDSYRADFLWPHEQGSLEEAGYEFANAGTEDYRKIWWLELISRIGR